MFKEGTFRIFGHTVSFRIEPTPNIPTVGITNKEVNPKDEKCYVLFLDYDNVNYEVVKEDLKFLNLRFNFCTFLTLKSSESLVENQWKEEKEIGNYHVMAFERLSYAEVLKAIQTTRCEELYKKVPLIYSKRCWVLRIKPKYALNGKELVEYKPQPEVKEVIQFSKHCKHEHCNAFYQFAKNYWNTKFKLKNLDNCREVEILEYNTVKK